MVVNKKGLKLCGRLLALFIMLGLSLSVFSNNTNAFKYPINTIDIGDSTYEFAPVSLSDGDFYVMFQKNRSFGIAFNGDHPAPSGFSYPHTWRFSGNYNSSDNTCELADYSDGVWDLYYASSNMHYFTLRSLRDPTLNFNSLNSNDSPFDLSQPLTSGNNSWLLDSSRRNLLCSLYEYSYTSHTDTPAPNYANLPRWNWSSLTNIPLVNNRFAYSESEPYYYQFNKLYLLGTDKINGAMVQRHGLKMSDIFGTKISDFSQLGFSFDLFGSSVNRLDFVNSPETEISNFSLNGSIYFDSDYTFGTNCYYNSPSCLMMTINNYNLNPRASSSDYHLSGSISILSDGSKIMPLSRNTDEYYSSVQCTVNQYHTSSGDDSNHIDFSCPYSPSSSYLSSNIDFRLLDISIQFGNTVGYTTNFFHTDGDYTFKDFYVVTNNNDYEIDWDASDVGTGGNKLSAPGYGLGGGGSEGGYETDWFSSLLNSFSFNFFNPFAGIFNLFGDSSSCASIPTIAGMIHSEETSVCPWFDSTTRAITTPVVGLASVMLVFGFAVRWLGSSSGNLFEDSGHEEISNVNGSGWRRFKK